MNWPLVISRANRFEPVTLVRSPIIVKLLSGRIVSASRPERRVNPLGFGIWDLGFDTDRGGRSFTASAIARMWSGVVPQQPPSTLTNTDSAQSRSMPAVSGGISSYWPNALGRPALGYAVT